MVVAYGLVGNIRTDLTAEPIGEGFDGQAVYLKDIWPTQMEIDAALQNLNTEMFHKEYAEVFEGDAKWKAIQIPQSQTYTWDEQSTYIRHPPFLQKLISRCDQFSRSNRHGFWLYWEIQSRRTIFPLQATSKDSPAGRYLQQQGLMQKTLTLMDPAVATMR